MQRLPSHCLAHLHQLREGFKVIDNNLHVFDEAMEK
jgi:hypothetical protein